MTDTKIACCWLTLLLGVVPSARASVFDQVTQALFSAQPQYQLSSEGHNAFLIRVWGENVAERMTLLSRTVKGTCMDQGLQAADISYLVARGVPEGSDASQASAITASSDEIQGARFKCVAFDD